MKKLIRGVLFPLLGGGKESNYWSMKRCWDMVDLVSDEIGFRPILMVSTNECL